MNGMDGRTETTGVSEAGGSIDRSAAFVRIACVFERAERSESRVRGRREASDAREIARASRAISRVTRWDRGSRRRERVRGSTRGCDRAAIARGGSAARTRRAKSGIERGARPRRGRQKNASPSGRICDARRTGLSPVLSASNSSLDSTILTIVSVACEAKVARWGVRTASDR